MDSFPVDLLAASQVPQQVPFVLGGYNPTLSVFEEVVQVELNDDWASDWIRDSQLIFPVAF